MSHQIIFDNVSKGFDGKPVLSSQSLQLTAGKYRLDGANGAGKSTVLKLIAGVERVDKGCINLIPTVPSTGSNDNDGFFVVADWVVFPSTMPLHVVVGIYIRHGNIDEKRLNALIVRLHLSDYMRQCVNEISTGTLQKIKLVLALASHADWLLLDEPFNGLDSVALPYFLHAFNEEQRAIIIVDHRSDERLKTDQTIKLEQNLLCLIQ